MKGAIMTVEEGPELEALTRALFDNFPEAGSGGVCPACIGWDHDDFLFEFADDDGKRKTIGLEDAKRGVLMLIEQHIKGQHAGLEIKDYNDPGDYDWDAVLAAAQLALYGEVIYG